MDLETLGIDIEGLKQDVLIRTVDEISRELKREIISDVRKEVKGLIAEHLDTLCREALLIPYQRVDTYGKEIGEPTTLRQLFVDAMDKYWQEKVSKDGKPTTSYQAKPRYKWIAEQVVYEVLNHKLKLDLNKITENAKKALIEGISEVVANQIEKKWKKL